MTTRKLTAALAAAVLVVVGAGCKDRENVDSGNQGQKEPTGGTTTVQTSPGATIAPDDSGQ